MAEYELRNGSSPCDEAPAFAGTLATGYGDPLGDLPAAFSHRPQQLADEMAAAGLVDIEVLGIEGPGWCCSRPPRRRSALNGL